MSEESGAARTIRPARPRSLTCPNCGGVVTVRAAGLSVSAVCQSCGAVLDVTNESVRLIAEANRRTVTPLIAIGARGRLAGTEWQVVGYQERSTEGGAWDWQEYLLFNPYRGFRFLSQDHGHWTLYAMLRQEVGEGGVIAGDPHRYRAEASGLSRTDYVLGEFYWRVKAGDVVSFAEYVDPPYVLSMERASDEVTWSRGVYLEPDVVKAAFALTMMPPREGSAPHQPGWGAAAGKRPRKPLWWTACAFIVLLLVLESVSFGPDHNRMIYQQTFTVGKGDKDRSLASPAFEVPDKGGNLKLDVAAASWPGGLKVDLALAAADGSRRFDFPLLFAAFNDPDSPAPSATFPSVPGGTYKLLADVDASAVVPPAVNVTVRVWRHPPDAINFLLALVLILLWPTADAIARWIERLFRRSEE